MALETPPPAVPTPSPIPQLEPLLPSFRTDTPREMLDIPPVAPPPVADVAEAPEPPPAPAPEPPPAQLDPLLDSFRTDEPPDLLELPSRSPVVEPESEAVAPEPPPAPEPAPTLRPPPPLAAVPTPPAPAIAPAPPAEPLEAIAPAPPAPEPQAAISGPTELARPIPGRQRQPEYPSLARRRNQEGRVTLRARVDETGQVIQVEVSNSSGYPSLDEAAADAVEQWQFSPARRGEEAIASWVNIPINFSLQ
ncbi:MAG: energy transducer TonB [Cyanobacteria bacterium J06639_1]